MVVHYKKTVKVCSEDEELLYFNKSEKVFPPVDVVAGSGSVPVHASQG